MQTLFDFVVGSVPKDFLYNPWVLFTILFLVSLLLEDLALALGLYFISIDIITPIPIFFMLAISIAVGDFALYALGRWLEKTKYVQSMVKKGSHSNKISILKRQAMPILISARFIPGLRLPTYTIAGVIKVSLPVFLLATATASILWTGSIILVGQSLIEIIKDLTNIHPFIILMILFFCIWNLINIFHKIHFKRKQNDNTNHI